MDNPKIQNDIEKMKADYNRVSLSFAERENLKASIFEKINSTPVKSPYFNWSFYTKATSLAFATFVLITSPIVAAAQKSLPGDFLYPVKTQVNENVVEIFVPQEEREEYHKTLLTKRAFEIKTLSEEGELSEEQIQAVEIAIEDSVSEVLTVSELNQKTEEEIIQDHQDVIAVLEFSSKIIEENKSEEVNSKIDEFKVIAENSLVKHVETITNSDDGVEDSVNELIEDAKEIIETIPEEDKKEFSDEVEKIENTNSEPAVVQSDVQDEIGLMSFSAKMVEEVESVKEQKTENKLDRVLELHEQIAERKIELEIEKLEKSVNMSF